MSRTLTAVTKDVLGLSRNERFTLARLILAEADLPAEPLSEVEAAWDAELARRLESVRNGTTKARPFAEVFADLDRQFAR